MCAVYNIVVIQCLNMYTLITTASCKIGLILDDEENAVYINLVYGIRSVYLMVNETF